MRKTLALAALTVACALPVGTPAPQVDARPETGKILSVIPRFKLVGPGRTDTADWLTAVPEITLPAEPAPAPAPAPVPARPRSGVEQWRDVALAAGWPEWTWPTLAYVIGAESGGDPEARSRTGDTGLLQVNDVHLPRLCREGIACSVEELKDPYVNLVAGLTVWQRAGESWRPWSVCSGGRCAA